MSYALSLSGHGKPEATAASIDWVCAGRSSLARRERSVDVVRFREPDPERPVRRVTFAAGTGVLTQAAHPDMAIGGRLIVLAWLLPVIGLPLLPERVPGGGGGGGRGAGAVQAGRLGRSMR